MYLLVPLCLCIAALFILIEKKEKYILADVMKGLASLCFVILGIMNSDGSSMAKLIVYGLILGAIADVLLNLRYVFQGQNGKLAFLAGIMVFLSGHLVYLAAILPMVKNRMVVFVIGVILTAVLMKWLFTKITAEKAFKIFGIFYIGAITLMNCSALSALISYPSLFTTIFTLGAVLFLISDLILILNTFGPEAKFTLRVANLMLYYIGQLLIALSLMFL